MEEDKISTKDIPSYHWPTKEKGKAQYPKFAKDFQGTLKDLRIVVEPGGIDRYLGPPPGRRPNNADERAEWLVKSNNYQNKLDKVEMFCATKEYLASLGSFPELGRFVFRRDSSVTSSR